MCVHEYEYGAAMGVRRCVIVSALCLVQAAAYGATRCPACAAPQWRPPHGRSARLGRVAMMSAAAADDEGPEPEPSRTSDDLPDSRGSAEVAPWTADLETLAKRMQTVRQDYELTRRCEALSAAWVLVFDAETDDEAVYSMQIGDDEDAHAVLAFEEEADAKRYALSLRDEPNSSTAAVQALDFEALVVTSRDAEFAVAVVFQARAPPAARRRLRCCPRAGPEKPTLHHRARQLAWTRTRRVRVRARVVHACTHRCRPPRTATPVSTAVMVSSCARCHRPQGDIGAEPKVDEREIPLFASDAAAALSMSVTMVPEEVFAGKSASDYVDPAEDPICERRRRRRH